MAGVLYGPMEAGEKDDFLNRFLFQNLEIKPFLVPKEKRLEFDRDYDSFLQNLTEAKTVKKLALEKIGFHKKELATGQDGKITGSQININHPIDLELNIFFKDFFIRGAMATERLSWLLDHWFGYNISFLFTDDEKKFEKGASSFKLKRDDPRFLILDSFVKSHREGWYSTFKDLRNKIEHQGFRLPQIKHRLDQNGRVEAVFPQFGQQTIEEVLEILWENLSRLCEEIFIFITSLELKPPYIIWQIPEEKRFQHNWARYKVAIPEYPEAKVGTS
ncbi:MAG: hypothetical protein AAB966_03675 [Patescibacteria group bacterium]